VKERTEKIFGSDKFELKFSVQIHSKGAKQNTSKLNVEQIVFVWAKSGSFFFLLLSISFSLFKFTSSAERSYQVRTVVAITLLENIAGSFFLQILWNC
jgi:hypothetical protein